VPAEVLDALASADPVLARMVIAILDGVTLQWLVERDRTTAAGVLEAFARPARVVVRRTDRRMRRLDVATRDLDPPVRRRRPGRAAGETRPT